MPTACPTGQPVQSSLGGYQSLRAGQVLQGPAEQVKALRCYAQKWDRAAAQGGKSWGNCDRHGESDAAVQSG